MSGFRFAAALSSFALGALGCGAPAVDRPDMVFIVVDTLRADHLSSYGYERETTPYLDRFAGKSVLFERVIAPSSWTKTSMASIMTSLNPLRHGVFRVEDALPGEHETLAEMLSAAGYRTIGLNTNPWLKDEFGFATGFDVYRTIQARWPYARAGDVGRAALEELGEPAGQGGRGGPGNRKPTFLYMHLMDVHAPSTPEPEFHPGEPLVLQGVGPVSDDILDREFRKGDLDHPLVRRRIIDLYDAEIRSVDRAIGEFLEELERRGWLDDAIVVVTSDHGEGFREHGIAGHGKNLYPEVIEIPLIVHAPGRVPGGVRVQTQVRGIDIAPTILALAGIELPAGLDGTPLFPLDPAETGERVAIAAVGGNDVIPDRHYVAVVWNGHLYIRETSSGSQELYDLASDPGAARDLGVDNPVATRLGAHAEGFDVPDPGRVRLDRDTADRLRALGYLP